MSIPVTPIGVIAKYPIAAGIVAAFGLGIAGYAIWKAYQFVQDPNKGTAYEGNGSLLTVGGAVATLGNATNTVLGGVPQTVGEALGSGLFSLFNGSYSPGVSLIVNFPDGSRHAVDGASVDGGVFIRDGVRYQLLDRDGKHYAVTT